MPKKEYKSDAEKIEKGKFEDGVLIHEQKDLQKRRKKIYIYIYNGDKVPHDV